MIRLFTLTLFCALGFSQNMAQEWSLLNPDREPLTLHDVYIDTTGFGWVVGESGTILHTTDFGETWTDQSDLLYGNLFHLEYVQGSNGQQAVVAGSKISVTQDGGQTWTSWIPVTNVGAYQGVAAPSAQAMYVTSNQGKLLKSEDAGVSFAEITTLPFEVEWTDIQFVTDSLGWLGSREGDILQTSDGGLSWDILHDSTFEVRIEFFWLDSLTGYMANNKNFLKTSDGGISWDTLAVNAFPFLVEDLIAMDPMNILVTQGARISRSQDGGMTWDLFYNHPYIGTGNQRFHANPDGKVWVANRWHSLLHSDDMGENWVDIFPGFRGFLSQVANWKGDTVIAAGNNSMMLKTTNGGLDWNEITDLLPEDVDARGLETFGPEQYVLAGMNEFYVTKDGGQQWTKADSFTGGFVVSLSQNPNGELFAPVQSSVYFHSADSGNTWTEHLLPAENLRYMSWGNDSLGLFTGRQGRIFRTNDGGQSWDSVALPVRANLGNSFWKSETEVFVLGESVWDSLIVSTDAGLTWQKQKLERRTTYDEIFFADSLRGWIIGGQGQVGYIFETTDGGQSWSQALLSRSSVFFGLTAYNEDSLKIWTVGQGGMIRLLGQLDTSSGSSTAFTEDFAEPEWKIYPNPSHGLISLEAPLPLSHPLRVEVFTLQGQEMATYSWTDTPRQINLGNLPSGWYMLRLQQGRKVHQQLVQIQPR